MDRTGKIVIALCIVLLMGWMYQNTQNIKAYQKAQEELKAKADAEAAAEAKANPTPAAASTPALSASPQTAASQAPAASGQPEADVPVATQTVATPLVAYTFTNLGGGIATATLLKHEGEAPGEKVVLNSFGKHPIGAVLEKASDPANRAYTVKVSGSTVVCERDTPEGIHITKTFLLPNESVVGKPTEGGGYLANLEVSFANRGAVPVSQPAWFVFAGSAEPIHAKEIPTYTGFDWFRDGSGTFIDVNWFKAGSVPLVGVQTSAAHEEYIQTPGGVSWAGVKNQYFTSILFSESPAQGVWANPVPIKTESKTVQGIEGALEMAPFTLAPGQTRSQKFSLYTGPKEYRILKALGHGESDMMNFGKFKIISIFLLRTMNWLNGWLHSYALAIIVLTFVVRGALWPIQGAATKSMKRMQSVQPKMAVMKEKYKDDPTRMNQEMMKLYKENGINPFAGCIPMFIQIPIFFGFYSMLGTAVELRNSHFLWVHDLSMPDTVMHLSGVPINILPVCMAATMLWQMSLSPKSGDEAQQKIMMFMPLMFVYFTYNFASALALYYTIQNTLSIIQLYVTRDQPVPATATASGSGGGGKNPARRP